MYRAFVVLLAIALFELHDVHFLYPCPYLFST
jgi:hypothetical protein